MIGGAKFLAAIVSVTLGMATANAEPIGSGLAAYLRWCLIVKDDGLYAVRGLKLIVR